MKPAPHYRWRPEWLPSRRPWQVALAGTCLLAFVAQVAMLPLRGTGDVRTFKEWGVSSLASGLTSVYREHPDDPYAAPDYPPISVSLISAATGVVERVFGAVSVDSRLLTFYIKLLTLLGGLAGAGVLWWHVRTLTPDVSTAFFWGAIYFLNPAHIVNGPLLGYLDPLCLTLGLAAIVCAGRRRFVAAAVLAVLSALVKPQGLFFLLPVAVTLWDSGRVARAATAAGATGVGLCLPFVIGSGPLHFGRAMLVNFREDMLSGNALNLWWMVTAVMRIGHYGWDVFDVRLSLVSVSHFVGLAGVNPRPWMAAIVIGTAAWLGWSIRGRRHVADLAAYVALVVHLYFVVAISVHENHLVYAAVPALIAAVEHREYRRLALGLNLLTAANMLLFYGVGRDWPEIPRVGMFLPLTVLLAGANVALLVAHARAFQRSILRRGEPADAWQAAGTARAV
ncbi:MAG: hypothetical protein AB7I25_12230 [Vicinamibacterales bacterium]